MHAFALFIEGNKLVKLNKESKIRANYSDQPQLSSPISRLGLEGRGLKTHAQKYS